MNHLELLKKFILVAGGASGQCQVEYAVNHEHSELLFSEEEKQELMRLRDLAEKEYFND